jgi:2-C-methyl-D-erythritol 4-phosphate cytidylyltransferase
LAIDHVAALSDDASPFALPPTAPSMPQFTVILPAAGASTRFGGDRNKIFEMLGGQPVIAHALRAFLSRDDVAGALIATAPASRTAIRDALGALADDPRVMICDGGPSRAHSVRNALRASAPSVEWVAVHDAARPLVSDVLIDRALAAAAQYGAAVPALPVALTIKQATGPLPAPVERTLPRHTLWAMQTPQIARRRDLLDAFDRCPVPLEQVTDDVQLIELAGGDVWLVAGEERNLKITTPADLLLARSWLDEGLAPPGASSTKAPQ